MSKVYNVSNSKINNIHEWRNKRKIGVEELSNLSGIGVDAIRRYEHDSLDLRKANLSTIISLCNALKVSPVKLFKQPFSEELLKICRKNYLSK